VSNGQDPLFSDDPYAPLYGALIQHLESKHPLTGQTLLRRPFSGALGLPGTLPNPFLVPLQTLFNEIIGAGDVPSTGTAEEAVGAPAPGSRALDVTDPAVDPGDVKLGSFEKFIRTLRTVGRAAHGAAVSAVPGTSAGIERLYMEGELLRPRNKQEQILHGVGALLAGFGIFGPLGASGAAGTSLTRSAGQAILGKSLTGLAARAGRTPGFFAEAAGSTLFDTLIGGTFGVGELAGREALGTGEYGLEDYTKAFALFSAVGGALGTLFRPATALNLARGASRLSKGLHGEIPVIPDGAVVGGKRAETVNGRQQWRWIEGENKGKLTTLTDEEVEAYRKSFAQAIKERVEQSPEGQAAKAAVETATPARPESIPPDLNHGQIVTIGSMYYHDQAFKTISHKGPEKVQAMVSELKKMMFDPALTKGVRESAAGQVLAFERALAEAAGTPIASPIEVEAAAVELIRRVQPKIGKPGILRIAADERARGNSVLAARIEALAEGGKLPDRFHDEVYKRLGQSNKLTSRGMRRGTRGFVKDRPVELMTDPEYGLSQAKYLDKAEEPFMVDVREIAPMPVVGRTAKLKDGTVVKVQGLNVERGQFMGTPASSLDAQWYSISEIEEVGLTPTVQAIHEQKIQEILSELDVSDLAPVPPIPASTPEGEAVTVTKIGAEAAEIRTKQGVVKEIPRDQLRRSTASGVEVGEREIVDFAPGKIPDEGNKILFFTVVKEEIGAFEKSFREGKLTPDNFPSRANVKGRPIPLVHVLPPFEAREEIALYAVEVPATLAPLSKYSELARTALKALDGQARIQYYLSPIDLSAEALAQSRIYRVPESLHAATQRPTASLSQLSPEQEKAYLRNLINFSENVPSEVNRPIQEARVAQTDAAKAFIANDGPAVLAATERAVNAHVDALAAAARLQNEILSELDAPTIAEVAAGDAATAARIEFERQGFTPETAKVWLDDLAGMESSPAGGWENEVSWALSRNVPGQKAFVVRRARATVTGAPGALKPTTEFYYEIVPVDPGLKTLREAIVQVATPQEAADYLMAQGYAPTLYKGYGRLFSHTKKSNYNLRATIKPTKAGEHLATIEERIEVPSESATQRGGPTPEQKAILVELGEQVETLAAGQTVVKKMSEKSFASFEEAEAWLQGEGFARQTGTGDMSPAARFSKLPPTRVLRDIVEGRRTATVSSTLRKTTSKRELVRETLPPEIAAAGEGPAIGFRRTPVSVEETPITRQSSPEEALEFVEDDLMSIMENAISIEGRLPEALQDYAGEFSSIYVAATGRAPFSRYFRTLIGRPTVEDMGPAGLPQVLADADVKMGNVNISTILPPRPRASKEARLAELAEATREQVDVPPQVIKREDRLGDPLPDIPIAGAKVDKLTLRPAEAPAPKMASAEAGHIIPRNQDIVYGLIGGQVKILEVPSSGVPKVLEVAKKIGAAQKTQSEWTDAYIKSLGADSPAPTLLSPANLNIGRYKPTGRVVEIVEVPLTGTEVKVRFPGTGEVMAVDRSLVSPGRYKSKDVQDYLLAETLADGTYARHLGQAPPPGFGKIAKQLGLYGTNDRQLLQTAYVQRAYALAQGIRRVGDTVDGSLETMSELLDLYGETRWLDVNPEIEVLRGGRPTQLPLSIKRVEVKTEVPGTGIAEEVLPGGPGEAPLTLPGTGAETTTSYKFEFSTKGLSSRVLRPGVSTSDQVLDAIRAVDPKLVRPFKWAAYQHTKAAWGNNPFGELVAKAQADWLEPHQVDLLQIWAKDLGLKRDLPTVRIVQELISRRLLDPKAAAIASQLREEAAIARWFEEADVPALLCQSPCVPIEVKIPKVNDLYMDTNLGIPSKVARRHPVTRLANDLIYRAYEKALRVQQHFREFTVGLQQSKYSHADRVAMRKIIQTHETWDEAAKAGAPARYQDGFRRYKNLFEDGLEKLKRQFIRRRVEPVKYDPENPAMRAAVEEMGFAPGEFAKDALFLPKTPDLVRNLWKGEVPSGHTADEIETFITLQRQYPDAASLPQTPDVQEWMREQFDFWKGFKRNNYWPLVHEGNLVLTVKREGKKQIVAWVQTRPDAVEALRILRADGRVGADEAVSLSQRSPIYDDILVKHVPAGEQRQLMNAMADQVELGPDDFQALLLRTDRPKEFVRAPGQVHGKPRTIALEPVILDPDRELAIWNARIGRMDYRWDIMEAHRVYTDQALDKALSDAHHAPRLWEGFPNLRSYMTDRFSKALGEQGRAEKFTDQLYKFYEWFSSAPTLAVRKWLKGDVPLDWAEIRNPNTFYRKYAARQRMGGVVALQSLYRLGFGSSAALFNATQFFVTTVPKLIEPGLGPVEVGKLALSSWRDGIKIWSHQQRNLWRGARGKTPVKLSKELVELAEDVDAAGVYLLPSKQLAGAGHSYGDVLSGPPIAGASKSELFFEWADYLGMFMFNGAEKVNQYGTAIAAIKRAKAKGLSRLDGISAARQLVEETQFRYDELSIPNVLAAAGPVGRVLFQFKPFMLNMLSFEKDLLVKAFRPGVAGRANAVAQLGTHVAALSVLGGLVGLLHHPVLSALGGAIKLATGQDTLDILGAQIPLTPTGAEKLQQERRRDIATPEENFTNTMHYRWDDLLQYGVPGLLHLSVGQRVGVSGQEMLMGLDAPGILGPHGSVYWDVMRAWSTYMKQSGSQAGVAGGVAGAVLPSLLPKSFQNVAPFLRAGSSLIGGTLASMGSSNQFADFLTSSREGRNLLLRDTPTIARNAIRTFELFTDGAMRDINGKPMYIPAANRTEELAYVFFGLPSIRREEYQAAGGFLVGQAAKIDADRETFTNRIARAWAENNFEEAYELSMQATELGIEIPEGSIQRELDAITQEKLYTIQQQLPVAARFKKAKK